MKDTDISRRDLLAVAGVAAAGVVTSGSANAASHSMEHHHHSMPAANLTVVAAARDCITKGHECLDHCLMLFSINDMSVAACAAHVNLMIPMCETLAKHANTNATYLKKVAAVCIDVCTDCEKECRKHADKHKECKACAESCAACIKACKELLAA